MRREIPLIITFVIGLIMLLTNFFGPADGSDGFLQIWADELGVWMIIVSAFAVGLASVNLIRIHSRNIARQRPGWINSLTLIVAMAAFAVVGTIARLRPQAEAVGELYQNMFDYVQSPLGAAMFAILAFYIASASYRAFRMRSLEATILLISAVLVMLGRAPIGELIWNQFPGIATWLLNIPNTAGQKAIMIGAAIGAFATSLRILLGIERGHLGME
ncbi:MAG: hypothetical protein ACOX2K_08610 [Bacillota bacterium]